MKTELYIENQLIELDESVQFTITKEFSNLLSPTDIINDWTKEIAIPFTNHNNKVFGHIFIPDTVRKEGDYKQMFDYFNPNKKMNFSLRYNGEEIMVGYIKMNSIVQNEGKGVYNITLNGELGKVFQELKKITFDNKQYTNQEDIDKYYIKGSNYVDDIIDRNTVIESYKHFQSTDNFQTDRRLTPSTTVGGKFFSGNGTIVNHSGMQYLEFILPDTTSRYVVNNIISTNGYSYTSIYYFDNNRNFIKSAYPIKNIATYNNIWLNDIPENTYYLVINSRIIGTPTLTKLKSTYEVLGFAPINAFINGFDYKTLLVDIDKNMSIEDYLKTSTAFNNSGIAPSNLINEGVLPRTIGDFRSYLHQPYIYFNKLFKIFELQCNKTLPNYEFELDEKWFNTDNKYYYNLCYLLNPFNTEENEESNVNLYRYKDNINFLFPSNPTAVQTNTLYFNIINEQIPIYDEGNGLFLLNNESSLKFEFQPLEFKVHVNTTKPIEINENTALQLKVNFINEYEEVTDVVAVYLTAPKTNIYIPKGSYHFPLNSTSPYTNRYEWVLSIPFNEYISWLKYGKYVKIKVNANWLYTNDNTLPFNKELTDGENIYVDFISNYVNVVVSKGNKHSFTKFNLNDLWNNEFNLFEEILKYCKMFGILIQVDNINNKIKFIRRDTYFKKYKIEDWGDKIDFSKDYTVNPVRLDNKYLLFNYEDDNTKINKEYKEKYGVNYGEIKVNTNYAFNNESTNMFKQKISNSIVSSPNIFDLQFLYNNGGLIQNTVNEIYIDLSDEDGKYVNKFGSYYIRTSNQKIDSTFPDVYISDDSSFMQANNLYYFNYFNLREKITELPTLTILDEYNHLILFNKPNINYAKMDITKFDINNAKSIYYQFWDRYINEIYNSDTKLISCYVKLNPIEFKTFDFNNFVMIGNQLYRVNKIYDYNIEGNGLTKVDLISINQISNYTVINYDATGNTFANFKDNTIYLDAVDSDKIYNVILYSDYQLDDLEFTTSDNVQISNISTLDSETVYVYSIQFKLLNVVENYSISVKNTDGVVLSTCNLYYSIDRYFNLTPTEVNWEADGNTYSTSLVIDTNYTTMTMEKSSDIIKINKINDYRLIVEGSSAIPTAEYIKFTTPDKKEFYCNIYFYDKIKIIPNPVYVNKNSGSSVVRIEASDFERWYISTSETELIFNLNMWYGVSFSKYVGQGNDRIQITNNGYNGSNKIPLWCHKIDDDNNIIDTVYFEVLFN